MKSERERCLCRLVDLPGGQVLANLAAAHARARDAPMKANRA